MRFPHRALSSLSSPRCGGFSRHHSRSPRAPPPLAGSSLLSAPRSSHSDAGGDHPPAKRGRVEPVDLYPPQVYDTRLAPRMKDPRAVLLDRAGPPRISMARRSRCTPGSSRALKFWLRFDALHHPRNGVRLTQFQVAEALGVPVGTIRLWILSRGAQPAAPAGSASRCAQRVRQRARLTLPPAAEAPPRKTPRALLIDWGWPPEDLDGAVRDRATWEEERLAKLCQRCDTLRTQRMQAGLSPQDIAAVLGTSASDVTHWEAGRKRDVVTKWAQEGRAQLLAWGWPRQDMDGAALSLHLWEAQRAAQFWERFDALLQPRDGTVLQRRHIAQALGVAQQTVADWMNGRNRPMPGAPVEAATTATTADGEERTHETPPPPRPAAPVALR